MPVRKEDIDPKDLINHINGPIPGQSLTHAPKSMPWENPPQHTELAPTMEHLWDQLIQPDNMKQIIYLMEMGLSIEEITRTVLFAGFTMGKWTPDLALLMYKPLTLLLMAMAKRAGLNDTPMVMKERLHSHIHKTMQNHTLLMHKNNKTVGVITPFEKLAKSTTTGGKGFMSNG